MKFKKSFNSLIGGGKPDILPQFEWGYWPETLGRWRKEGLPEKVSPWDATGITNYYRLPVETRAFPHFEEKILEDNGECLIVQDPDGIIKEVSRDTSAFPRYIKHPVESMADFEKLKERLDPRSPGRFPEAWSSVVKDVAKNDGILFMGDCEISFFGWHRDLMGVENLLLAYYEQPELIHAISRHHLGFLKELYSRMMKDVNFDVIFFWEDMSYKNGSLISPALVREFMLPYYKDLISFFKGFNKDYKVLVDSDGDVSELIPLFMEAGVDGMLPFECAAGMDIRKIREQYPDLLICGGIDKREIAKGKASIDRELEAKLPYMFKRGRYLPTLDHHVPPEISFDDFNHYLQKTREIHERTK